MSFLHYKDFIEDGDTVIVYLSVLNIYALKITAGSVFQTKYGALKHSEVIGKRYGDVVSCSHGWVYILFPTPELWTLTLPHRTQILYSPDISLITLQLDLKPGSVVCEAGTGSGSLSHAIARTIAPTGHLYTFDFHENRAEVAKAEFASHGLDKVVTVQQRDVCQNGFGLKEIADAVFLDLPHPWEAILGSVEALKTRGGRLCSFSPCIEQVQRTVEALGKHGFSEMTTVECVFRPYEVKQITLPEYDLGNVNLLTKSDLNSSGLLDETTRKRKRKENESCGQGQTSTSIWTALPPLQIAGHTGFLTFASLK